LAATTGARIKTVAAPDGPPLGAAWNAAIMAAIDSATAVVAMPHVHWATGTRFDLETIGERARSVGAALIIDGTQSVGALAFDIAAVAPDALICAAYKWLMGPYGIGFAYYGERFSDGVPLEENWITRAGAEDFSRLVAYEDAYAPGAVRFDMGERSNPILLAMAIAALDEILETGVAARQAYCRDLLTAHIPALTALGLHIEPAPWRADHLLGLKLPPGSNLEAVTQALVQRNVIVSVRGDAIRVSPNVYNDRDDLATLTAALTDALD
jgi:selenocysteine lyase/cysteine desulfurase